MKEIFIKAILLLPLYFFQQNSVTGNSQGVANRSTHSSYIISFKQSNEKSSYRTKSSTPVFKNLQMDVYPADVLTGIPYIYFMNHAAGSFGKANGYLYSFKEQNRRSSNKSSKSPEKTTTLLFVIASVITLIGSAQLATKLQFDARNL